MTALSIDKIEEWENNHDIYNLILALKNGEEDVRASAAAALGYLKDERAIQPLIKTLEEEHSFQVYRNAADSIRKIKQAQ